MEQKRATSFQLRRLKPGVCCDIFLRCQSGKSLDIAWQVTRPQVPVEKGTHGAREAVRQCERGHAARNICRREIQKSPRYQLPQDVYLIIFKIFLVNQKFDSFQSKSRQKRFKAGINLICQIERTAL